MGVREDRLKELNDRLSSLHAQVNDTSLDRHTRRSALSDVQKIRVEIHNLTKSVKANCHYQVQGARSRAV